MHREAEMTNIAPKLCELFRARPPMEIIKTIRKPCYKKKPYRPLVDPYLASLEE
jgi:hypothetical protein